ncbi:MAG: DNA/RNA nuclease SfsA [Ruminococcaceae bacterium]|nr:DNA/RNA nuclease SfsA [Oscillospiraceae bacterium]
MQYLNVIRGCFLERPNRFIAQVDTGDGIQTVHVKNTGRCRELLTPGAVVYLERGTNPKRKTQYDLIAVEKGERLINIDSQAPNRVFEEWAVAGGFLSGVTTLRREVTLGDSRLDFCLETEQGPCWVEVKGVTLEEDGVVRFPDAPTERGVKHIRELQRAADRGMAAVIVFVIQMEGVSCFRPNDTTHPAFGAALREAAAHGVGVYAVDCRVTPESLMIGDPVPVIL